MTPQGAPALQKRRPPKRRPGRWGRSVLPGVGCGVHASVCPQSCLSSLSFVYAGLGFGNRVLLCSLGGLEFVAVFRPQPLKAARCGFIVTSSLYLGVGLTTNAVSLHDCNMF